MRVGQVSRSISSKRQTSLEHSTGMYKTFLFLSVAAATVLLPAIGRSAENVEGSSSDDVKYCQCSGPTCECCVDFNITYIDLGGPGCVKMKYLSQDEGIQVNVSYGESQLHQGLVKGNNESATCMDILLDLAQMCATFNEIARTEEGLRACASLEPTFLGDPQDSYHLGCFHMGSYGMKLSTPVRNPEPVTEGSEKPATGDSIFEAVNESAEDGIAWFTNFWGINFIKEAANGTESTTE